MKYRTLWLWGWWHEPHEGVAWGLQWPFQWGYRELYYDGPIYALHIGPLWFNW